MRSVLRVELGGGHHPCPWSWTPNPSAASHWSKTHRNRSSSSSPPNIRPALSSSSPDMKWEGKGLSWLVSKRRWVKHETQRWEFEFALEKEAAFCQWTTVLFLKGTFGNVKTGISRNILNWVMDERWDDPIGEPVEGNTANNKKWYGMTGRKYYGSSEQLVKEQNKLSSSNFSTLQSSPCTGTLYLPFTVKEEDKEIKQL